MYSRLQELITIRSIIALVALENPLRINKPPTNKIFLKELSMSKTNRTKSRIQVELGNKKQNINYPTTPDITQARLGKNTSSPSKGERDLTHQTKITEARALSTTIRLAAKTLASLYFLKLGLIIKTLRDKMYPITTAKTQAKYSLLSLIEALDKDHAIR